jgi:RNA polymerase sigma factor (sigma-70 family)
MQGRWFMTEQDRASLLRHLVARYEDLLRRLTYRLGSAVTASEALHDTYLRIGQADTVPAVSDPHAYLLRVASNLVADRRRSQRRQRLADVEIDKLLDIADEAPGPHTVAESRMEMLALAAALRELPDRCRAIFMAARLENMPHDAIATRFGVSRRTVANEIQRALTHCAERLEKKSR